MTEAQSDVLDSLKTGPMNIADLADDTGRSESSVRTALRGLRVLGHVQPFRGSWRFCPDPKPRPMMQQGAIYRAVLHALLTFGRPFSVAMLAAVLTDLTATQIATAFQRARKSGLIQRIAGKKRWFLTSQGAAVAGSIQPAATMQSHVLELVRQLPEPFTVGDVQRVAKVNDSSALLFCATYCTHVGHRGKRYLYRITT